MHGQRIAAVLAAVLMVTSMVAVSGSVAAQSDPTSDPEPVPASYYGTVQIDGDPAGSSATVSAVVDGEVVDELSVNESGWYGGPDLGQEKLTVTADDVENDTTVEFRVNGDPVTRTDPSSIEWGSSDVQRVDLRAGSLDPIYEFDIEDLDETVPRGDDAEISVSIENTGDPGSGELTVTADGEDEPRASRQLDLDTNETTTEVLSVPTSEDDGEQVTFQVATDEESQEVTVDLQDPSNFTVSLDPVEPADGDQYVPSEDDLNGTVTVQNAGEVTDEQNVSVSFGDETLVDRAVELDGGNDDTIEFNRTLDAVDAGDTTLTATTDDDIATQTVSVLRPGELEVDVIEAESTLDPVARQNISIVAEVTNVGETEVTDRTVTLTNVTTDASDVASEDFTLAPGESEDFDPSVTTSKSDAGNELSYEIDTDDDSETVTADIGEVSPFLDVIIDGLNESSVKEPAEDETIPVRVDATAENLGTEDLNGNVTFTANGEEFETVDVNLGDQEETSIDATYDLELGDAPEVTIEATAERDDAEEPDSVDETTLDVTPQAEFAVSINEATNVSDDLSNEEFTPTVVVENVGEQPGSGSVEVFFNGSSQETFDVSPGPGSDETAVQPNDGFSINASDFDEGEYLLEAQAANDATGETTADTDRVAIGEPANFVVNDVSVPSSVDQGDAVDVEATIENTGGVDAEKPVTFEFGGTTLGTTDLNLSDGEVTTETVTYTTTSADAGETIETSDVSVSTPDDEATESVDVRANAEFEADLTIDESAIAGDTVTAGVTVTNVGGNASNTTDVRLLADGQEVANTAGVELASGEQTTEQFELSPESAGELAVQGVTDDDVAEATVDVGEPGELDLSVRSVTDPVTADENVTVTVAAENVGDGDLESRRVRFSIDGSLTNTTTVDVAGGATETVELSGDPDLTVPDGESKTVAVSVVTPEDRVDRDVTVQPVPDDAYFRVDGLEASADEVLNTSDANVTVNATVTNIGDLDGTQNVTFTAGDAVSETNEDIQLNGNDDSTEVSFEFDISELDLDEEESTDVTYEIGTVNQTDEGTLTVTEPEPATPELVDVAVDETTTQEESLTATVTVRNVGDQPLDGNETVTLDYEDGSVANDSVGLNTSDSIAEGGSLESGAEATVDLSVAPPAEPLAGTFDREVTVGFGNDEFADDTVARTAAVDFEGVASGVDAAEADDTADTVTVRPGEYQARNTIEVPSGITVEADSPVDAPVIRQPSRDDETAMQIVGEDVTLDGLTFEGDGNGTAVEVDADDATLTSVRATNWSTGIDETAGSNALTGVEVSDTDVGIRLAGDNGTAVDFARVTGASDTGILVESGENEIAGAEVLSSATGIELLSAGTVVEGATVRNSADYGIRVTEVPGDVPEDANASDIDENRSVTIDDSVLESNSVSVFSDDSYVDATDNWWGGGAPVEGSDWIARSVVDDGDPLDSRPASNFVVDDSDLPDSVLRDEDFTIEPTIENDGSGADRQRIELRRGDGTVVDSRDLGLNASESDTVSLSDSTDVTDGEEVALTVASLDDTTSDDSVPVDDPASFALGTPQATPETVPLGEELSVEAPVDNTGDREGTVTAELIAFDGTTTVDSTVVAVGGTETTNGTLTWTPGATNSGQVTVRLTDDGTTIAQESVSVTVTDAALSDVSLSLTGAADDTLVVDESATVSVSSTFTDGSGGDVTAGATVTSSNETVATISGDTVTAQAAGTTTIEAEYDAGDETENDTVSLTVEAPEPDNETDDETGEDPVSSGGGGGGGGVSFGDDPADSLEFDAVETETVTPSIDFETNQRVATLESVSNVESIAFDSTDRVGEVAVSDVDPDSADVNPPGGAVTVQEISVPDDQTDRSATIAFRVSADRLDAIGAEPSELTAVRLNEGQWETLDTTVAEETADGVRLEAETPGFSVFAVNAVSEPDAAAAVDPGTVTAGEEVTLDGSDSTDEYGEIVAYDWSVSGQSLSGETATTTIDETGEYTAELTVTNDAGETDTATADLVVEPAADGGDGTAGGDGTDGGDAIDEPAGLGTTAIALLVALAVLAAAAVVWVRRNE
ncbi:CARDB domain-containing protein [Halorubrum laminariae]|uniref:CARDB domain-containing protein n=1 Tax=Halorubrum laminariae TaxID=1433523 RepID=A0ABD6C1E9_9EURY|nr:CARDB domain-containing protein [Halorubrum laminariae]